MTVSLVRARFAAVSAAVTALLVGAVVIGLSPFTAHAAPSSDLQSPDALSGEFGGKVEILGRDVATAQIVLFDWRLDKPLLGVPPKKPAPAGGYFPPRPELDLFWH